MKKVFVFCVGGTGIRVMKSIIMLMAGGMSTNGYAVVPIILDPHLDLEERKRLYSLIDQYQKIHQDTISNGSDTLNALDGFFGAELRTIDDLNGTLNNTQQDAGSKEKFKSYIGDTNLAANNINQFLVQTLFSSKSLESPLSVGFKGNPNVGTVVLGDMIENAHWFKSFKQHCQQGDRVFIISSIFGGTGASGFPLIVNKINLAEDTPAVKTAMRGAVTVLPYYKLKDPSTHKSDIDSSNFLTKTKSALTYYQKGKIPTDYLYYVGEQSLNQEYENDEQKQEDAANFIELVAASALFDFLKQGKPDSQQFLTRAIEDKKESLDLKSLGKGYSDLVKSVADFMLLRHLVSKLPFETYFPLKKTKGFDDSFYRTSSMGTLKDFCDIYYQWYSELEKNNRAFAPIKYDNARRMNGWIKSVELAAADDSYYLLEMIKAGNKDKEKDNENKFRLFVKIAYEAINHFTKIIYK